MNKFLVEYDPVLYPRLLWVTNDIEGLDEVFRFMSTQDTKEEYSKQYDIILEDKEYGRTIAATIPVVRREDNRTGVLVVLVELDLVNTDIIAHESVHVTDYMYEELGMLPQSFRDKNEQYAYLVGWIAGSISKSLADFKEDALKDKIKKSI